MFGLLVIVLALRPLGTVRAARVSIVRYRGDVIRAVALVALLLVPFVLSDFHTPGDRREGAVARHRAPSA